MSEGDYGLKGQETDCLIERKGSLSELAGNMLGNDWSRAMDAFKRFSDATANPYLMIECSSADLLRKTRWIHEPARVTDALLALVEKLGLKLLLVGNCTSAQQKRNVGELMLRLMLAHAYQKEEDYDGVEEVLTRLRVKSENNGGPSDTQED